MPGAYQEGNDEGTGVVADETILECEEQLEMWEQHEESTERDRQALKTFEKCGTQTKHSRANELSLYGKE